MMQGQQNVKYHNKNRLLPKNTRWLLVVMESRVFSVRPELNSCALVCAHTNIRHGMFLKAFFSPLYTWSPA